MTYEPTVLCSSCTHGSPIVKDKFPTFFDCEVKKGGASQVKKCRYYSGKNFPVDIVIVTATDVETIAVRKHLCPEGEQAWLDWPIKYDATYWSIAELLSPHDKRQKLRVAFAQAPFMGLAPAAVQVMEGINAFKPEYVVMLGITAGRKTKTKLGDIIIPSRVFDYGAGKWNGPVFEPAPHQLEIDSKVLRDCQDMKTRYRKELDKIVNDWPGRISNRIQLQIHCDNHHAVSGAAVVNSKEIWDRILKIDPKVVAIDMEAYAVLVAARHATQERVQVLIAKSVCDYGVKKNDKAQLYAAYTSVRFFRLYAEKYLFPRLGKE